MVAILPTLLFACPAPVWNLATADTRITIGVDGNRPIIRWLGCVHESTPWCVDEPETLIDHVFFDGKSIPTNWRFTGGSLIGKGRYLSLKFSSAPGLELESVWRSHPGRGPVEHWTSLDNHSKQSVAVPQMESLALHGLTPDGQADVWWSRRGASNAMTQGGVFQSPVKPGLDLQLVSDHHNGASPVPWCAVQVGVRRGLYVGWEFSSLGRVAVQTNQDGRVSIQAGLMPDFKTDIRVGEGICFQAAFVGCYTGDIDEGAQSLHRFVLEVLRARVPAGFQDPALLYNVYLDAGSTHAKEADLLRSEATCHDLGFEVFMPDAMWFPACGDWRWDPTRFPNGARPIEQAVHRDGMKLGLWCAWTNGGISSDPGALSVRGPVGHPDWFPEDLPATWQPGPFYGASACMACDAARNWEIAKTQSMVGDWHVDVLKTDCNPMINECSRTDHRHHYGTDVGFWSTLGVYDVWDRLRERYPNVVLENCSGASHIKDFGVVRSCAYTTVTDTLSNLPDRAGIYDSTFYLPPSALMTYTYERSYGVPGDDPGPYLSRSAMMTCWQIDPTNSASWTPAERDSIKRCVRDYKEWVRPIIRECMVHHVMPRPDGRHWDGMFFWSERLRHGAFFVFRPDSDDGTTTVKLAGLVPDHRYRVFGEDGSVTPATFTGRDLMDTGLRLRLPAKYTSDLIRVQG